MSQTEVDFSLPAAIKDFLFDLHDAVRRSTRMDEVARLYDVKFKEITEKYFAQSPWPDSKIIAAEVGNDDGFLHFYRYAVRELLFNSSRISQRAGYETYDHEAKTSSRGPHHVMEKLRKGNDTDIIALITSWCKLLTMFPSCLRPC
jgi:hypothetical protein